MHRSHREKTYPNDPLDTALGCGALIVMVVIPCLFVWGLMSWDWSTWWKIGVSAALFFLFARKW